MEASIFDPTLFILAGSGLAAGVAAAQIGGPVSWNWRPRIGAIQHRLLCLPRGAVPTAGRAAGLALVAALLTSGALAAYAAEPSVPERLAAQAAGVMGSGDQLSLKLRTPQGERELKIGEAYDEGWTLQALTAAKATLVKDGATREVGLNPTGAVAANAPAAAPTTVNVAGMLSEATIQAYADRELARNPRILEKSAMKALSLEEARRKLAFEGLVGEALDRRMADGGPLTFTPADQRALLGDAAVNDYWALDKKGTDLAIAAAVADLATRPLTGPTSVYVPAGSSVLSMGIDLSRGGGWAPVETDASGGRTWQYFAPGALPLRGEQPSPENPGSFATAVNGGLGVVRPLPLAR